MKTRQELINYLEKIGANDLTTEMHPNKFQKKFFRLYFKKTSYIDFNFDYEPYEHVFLTANIKNIKGLYTFNDAFELVKKLSNL